MQAYITLRFNIVKLTEQDSQDISTAVIRISLDVSSLGLASFPAPAPIELQQWWFK